MSMPVSITRTLFAAAASCLLASCAGTPDNVPVAGVDPAEARRAAIAASFEPKGQAGLDRLEQNDMQRICSEYEGQSVPNELAQQIIDAATAAVVFPADGNYFGDWRKGEWVAKTGTGLQQNDDPTQPSGGNCYACHQMAAEEIAYGTLAPPLDQYGKIRGTSEPILKYTWTRLWNSHAYNACSHMPRFGEAGILTEQQLKDVMAYLFDPASPVNLSAQTKP
ncbi:MAG TPA: sulfur oxidation c-type cytochrome SoxX [Patescibacteria group bacterium]|nr:sulfur oxidation c-type cytochrome SoxX [Patescibacteria group bacterium]